MRARPDVLQHPRQLPVCGHAVSRHLPAGLQPRVRAELAGSGGLGSLHSASYRLDPSSRPRLRHRPSYNQWGQPCLNSRAAPLCPLGRVPSCSAPACGHSGCQLAWTQSIPRGMRQRSREHWGSGEAGAGRGRSARRRDRVHIWGHMSTQPWTQEHTHRHTNTFPPPLCLLGCPGAWAGHGRGVDLPQCERACLWLPWAFIC